MQRLFFRPRPPLPNNYIGTSACKLFKSSIGFDPCVHAWLACERRRISCCRLSPPNQWQPEIHLLSQAMSEVIDLFVSSTCLMRMWSAGSPGFRDGPGKGGNILIITKNKKTCYLSWHWGSGLALYRAKPKQFTDFWRQFLTFIPGVPHNISGRKCDTKCELTPQSYVPSVTQPSTNGFAVQGIALFDSEPAIILGFSNLPLHCTLKSRTALHKDLKISRWWSLWCCVWWRSLFSA